MITFPAPRALVTVLKHVTVGEVKDSLLAVVGRGELSRELVLLAEVKDRSVSRVVVSVRLVVWLLFSSSIDLTSIPLPPSLPPSPSLPHSLSPIAS